MTLNRGGQPEAKIMFKIHFAIKGLKIPPLGSVPASSDTVELEGDRCRKYLKNYGPNRLHFFRYTSCEPRGIYSLQLHQLPQYIYALVIIKSHIIAPTVIVWKQSIVYTESTCSNDFPPSNAVQKYITKKVCMTNAMMRNKSWNVCTSNISLLTFWENWMSWI
jgi:hypothetical protein